MRLNLRSNTTERVFETLKRIHKNKYEYVVTGERLAHHKKIKIICKRHGVFEQRLDHHSNGHGCEHCGGSHVKTTEEFVKELRDKYGDRFLYDKVEYVKAHSKVILTCPEHGDFTRFPTRLLNTNCRCLKCMNRTVFDKESFEKRAIDIFGPIYDLSLVEYETAKTPVKILCRIHGTFFITPDRFFNTECPCPLCRIQGRSSIEKEWLDSLSNPNIDYQCHIKIGKKRFRVDGYDPTTNTIYEFDGDYFHGNPKYFDPPATNRVCKKSFGSLYQKTNKKHELFKEHGFNLVTIWESDFYHQIGRKYYTNPLRPEERLVARLAYLKQWEMSDDDFPYHIYKNIYSGFVYNEG